MPTNKAVIRWPAKKPRSAPIPLARDPFINTSPLRLSPDRHGLDRFWISSWNTVCGSLGVCVNEMGEARLYPFGSGTYPGFYSVVQTEPDTLWLCGNLSTMVRLNLKTGVIDSFSTGAPSALMFAGMALDEPSGKVCAIAFPGPHPVAVVFDTRSGKTIRTETLPKADCYLRSSFPNGDGTFSLQLQCPGLSFVRWDPRNDSLRVFPVLKTIEAHHEGCLVYRMIGGNDGRFYMPGVGWFNPARGRIEKGPRPADDTVAWVVRDKVFAYGYQAGSDKIVRWNLKAGNQSDVGHYPGAGLSYMSLALSRSGKLVSVSLDGVFTRIDVKTGELEMTRRLPSDSVQQTDCVIRIDRDRLLGTPFITQRFWETNLRTKKGYDCGLAAPGMGEILQVWNLGGKIYMAAYGGGELTEYDPSVHPHFPENPRVVAKSPTGMRPVGAADDGRRLFYTCSRQYGHLGSAVVRYDTQTGLAFYKNDPLPDQQITNLCYDKPSNSLMCGTTFTADCGSAPPATDRTVMAQLDADTLEPKRQATGPAGSREVRLPGPLGRNGWLGVCTGMFNGVWGARWFRFDSKAFKTPPVASLKTIAGWEGRIAYAGRPGLFVLKLGTRIELWDMRRPARVKVLADGAGLDRFSIQGLDLLVWSGREVHVLEGVLVPERRP